MRVPFVLALLMLFLSAPALTQSCYSPVTNWQADYAMTGTGNGKDGGGQLTWTVNHQMSGTPNLPGGNASCTTLEFGGPDSSVSGTVTDHAVWPNICPPQTYTVDITGGPLVQALHQLQIDLSAGTYQFSNDVAFKNTFNYHTCGVNSTVMNGMTVSPRANADCSIFATYPSFPLPPNIGTLVQPSAQFNGFACVPLGLSSSWTLGFQLVPVYHDDDDCKKQGGSSVGCRNQSLGEDIAIVGTGMFLHYEGSRSKAAGGDTAANTQALTIGGWTLNVHHAFDPINQTLYLGNGEQRNGYQLGVPVTYLANILITSQGGDEVYVFDPNGRHLQTLRPLTGALVYQFGYDASGNLIKITDASNNVTTIKRNAAGQATAIVSPNAQTTTLTQDANGLLSQVTDPLGKILSFANSADGLILSRTDANGNTYNYTYENTGRLVKDADPLGGFHALTRTNAGSGFGWTVDHLTALGTSSKYQNTLILPWIENTSNASFSQQQTNVWPSGLQATSSKLLQTGKLTTSSTLPDGTSITQTYQADPIWGLQTPVVTASTLKKGSLTMQETATRTITLGAPGNPFSVATQTDTENVNGRVYTSSFTGSTLTYLHTSPVKRTVTVKLDSQERVASTQLAGLAASTFAYTPKAKLASFSHGSRKTAFTYDTKGFLSTATDPLLRKTTFTYDADGNMLSATLPDGRSVAHSYDGNGNLLTITPPGKSAHAFTYTQVDLPASYTPPGGAPATTFAYDLDRNLTSLVRPGNQTIVYTYDLAGRLTKVAAPGATETFAYSATTGNLTSAARGTERVGYIYNGPLLAKSTWTGPVAGNVGRNYNNNFWLTSQTVNSAAPITFQYDNDGLVTTAGAMTIRRNTQNGMITGTTLGVVTDTRIYNSFGEITGYTASVSGTPAYSFQLTINADGMISGKTETATGVTSAYSYVYDLTGRLTSAAKNAISNSYSYDTNSNRLSATTPSGTVSATYDAQDRLLTYGATTFTYTLAGDLQRQKTGTQQTTYTYDALGNLTAATLPNGTKITYVVDGENNRVGRSVNGVYIAGFLYDDDRIVAQVNGSNQLVSQFVYAAGLGAPDYMITGGSTYRIIHDVVGSPVLVINTTTGAIAQQITYDEFGNVLADTNPGFQPFGFAGGLYDQDTKLVRFGARDYNPAIGRWTAKDPTFMSGGDTNLYNYAQADPVNHLDANGLGGECRTKDLKKKAKKVVDKVIRKVAGDKVKVGPINVSTTKPEISTGTSVEVKVEGQTVAKAEGEVTVGVTPYTDPSQPLVYIDTSVGVKIGLFGKEITIYEHKSHTEVGHAKEWRPWVDGFEKELDAANKAACETCGDIPDQP